MVMKLTQTIKFPIYFPNARKTDNIWRELDNAQFDITTAANKTNTTLWAVKQHVLPYPLKDGKKISLKTLAYRCFSGSWNPTDTEIYKPSTKKAVSSQVKLNTANLVESRINTDIKDIYKGAKSLATFRKLPLTVGKSAFSIAANGKISATIWEGRKNNKVVFFPSSLKKNNKTIFSNLCKGEYTPLNLRVYRDQKTNKWMAAISYSYDVLEKQSSIIAGIDIGIAHAVTVAILDTETGQVKSKMFEYSNVDLRNWQRIENERINRLRTNKDIYGIRSGKGRKRKLRSIESLRKKQVYITKNIVRNLAKAVARCLTQHGVSYVALENLTGITHRKIKETEEMSVGARAHVRKHFLQFRQGELRESLRNALQKEGIEVVEFQPDYTSKMCSSCGTIYSFSSKKDISKRLNTTQKSLKVKLPENGLGRTTQSKFKCACGVKMNADINAAINIANLGLKDLELKSSKVKKAKAA